MLLVVEELIRKGNSRIWDFWKFFTAFALLIEFIPLPEPIE